MSSTGNTVRLDWVDVAKGISIFLVVLIHARSWLEFVGAQASWIVEFNGLFLTMRMPLFFGMSGLLAARWVRQRSWSELFPGKLALLIWAFLIWQPVVFVYKYAAALILPDQEDSSLVAHLGRVIISPIRPNGELWFLWALVLFFLIAKLTRKVPVPIQLLCAAGVAVAWFALVEPLLGPDLLRLVGDGWKGLFTDYFFFIFALYGRRWIIDLAARTRWWTSVVVVVAWVGAFAVARVLGVEDWLILPFLLRVLGFFAGIAIALLLHNSRIFASLGRQTLPIYLAHTFFIVMTVCTLSLAGVRLTTPIAAGLAPWLLSVLAIVASLVLHRLANRGYGRFLYSPPRWFSKNRVAG